MNINYCAGIHWYLFKGIIPLLTTLEVMRSVHFLEWNGNSWTRTHVSVLKSTVSSCAECDDFHWGDNCAKECECNENAAECSNTRGCVCNPGWTGEDCTTDVNECDTVRCELLEKCVNRPGSYECVCMDGYRRVSGGCEGKVSEAFTPNTSHPHPRA